MIEVSVFANTHDYANNVCALRKRIDFENDLKFDPNSIVSSMRCLFGIYSVITFTYVP